MKGNKNKMKTNKIFATLIILAFVISIVPMTQVKAQTAPTMKTYAVVDAIPNPVGVGQDVLVKTGILTQLGTVDLGWTGLTITVVYPDNTTHTLGPIRTDSTGSGYTNFVPTQVGKYKFTTNFPQQTNPVGFFSFEGNNFIAPGTVMQASTSKTVELIVQEEALPNYPGHALPTEYWSRPIDPQLREWYSVSGNWVTRPDNSLALYNDDAPETAHVLWANQLTTGGLMGGLWGDGDPIPSSAEGGDAYEGKFPNSIAMNGILYYQQTDIGMPPSIIAVNLHTGEQWVYRNNTALSFGQIFYFNSFNYDGTFSYIWSVSGSTYTAYDPFTGLQMIKFNYVPSGTRYFGPSGEILILQMDFNNKWMALWNSTKVGLQNSAPNSPSVGSWGSQVQGFTFSANTTASYSWNVSIPAGLTPSSSFFAPIVKILPDRMMSVIFNYTQVRTYALSLAPGSQGQLLFDKTWAAPAEWLAGMNTIQYGTATNYVKDGVFTIWDKELTTHYAFSTETGSYLWQTESENWLDAYGWGNAEHTWYAAYGKLYSTGIGGILYAYDLKTGKTDWTYTMSDAFNEPVTGDNWWGWIDLIADGKIYFGTLEHSAEQPMPRGAPYICVNATTGEEIWRVNGMYRETRWGGNGIIADSIIATMDTYDQRVYAIGKGPTETTTTVSPKVSVEGSSVQIEGMVTDISPGTTRPELTARFSNGVPAVSDASMSAWMLYVYKQFDRPLDATGVKVTLSVVDSNGNYRDIGTTTSNSDGYFSFNWKPDISGQYSLYASFSGSKAYYPSHAVTSFAVDPAHPTAAPTDAPKESVADMYFVPAVAGIIVAIIVVGVLLALLLLRKRP
jgi:hypothetical protein